MVVILPPNGSLTFIGSVLLTLVLGFLIGALTKAVIKVGVIILVLVVVLIALGFIEPDQIIQPVVKYIESGPAVTEKVNQIAGYLPYSSLTFIVGFLIGFFKG